MNSAILTLLFSYLLIQSCFETICIKGYRNMRLIASKIKVFVYIIYVCVPCIFIMYIYIYINAHTYSIYFENIFTKFLHVYIYIHIIYII